MTRRRDIPREQMVKAQTLGASTWQIVLRVVLPQILPRLIDALRPALGPAWLFLIAAEAIAVGRAGSATASSSSAAISRWTSSCPTSPGSRCSPSSWTLALASSRVAPFPWAYGGARAMSAIEARNVWKEYGDQIVLEGVNLDDRRRRPSSRWSARPAAARPRSCACCSARSAPTRGELLLDGEPLPAEPGAGSRRRLPALFGVPAPDRARQRAARPTNSRQAPLLGRLFGAARRRADRRAPTMIERGRPRAASRQVSEPALRRHAAAARHRAGAGHEARRCCCSTSRSARSIPASARDMHALMKPLWRETSMTVVMVTHDLTEGLHARHPRHRLRQGPRDPQPPGAGARNHLRPRSDAGRRRAGARLQQAGRGGRTDGFAHSRPGARMMNDQPRRLTRHAGSPAMPIRRRHHPDALDAVRARWAGRRSRPRASSRARAGARSRNGRSTWACPAPKA